mmetsp:Transcript_10056/g.30111  ORF Transcript_10056/g.30111 Transcript_10056/m.30111 type:complete len:207 (+) Transcript_10056:185-805(+)
MLIWMRHASGPHGRETLLRLGRQMAAPLWRLGQLLLLQVGGQCAGGLLLGLEGHIRLQGVQLPQQLLLVDVVRHPIVLPQHLLDVVVHVHDVSHIVLHALNARDVQLVALHGGFKLLARRLHGLHCLHRVLHAFHHEGGLIHVILLAVQLLSLVFIESLLLQHIESPPLGIVLSRPWPELLYGFSVLNQLLIKLFDLVIKRVTTSR